ncbi:MAG: DNA polymerase ligase N-terminal domain-containing protein, partial [Candidatus Altimarinota bacterium]
MSLHKYKQKRHFDKTPEPKGKVLKNAGKPLTFMVHEHHASHLHYDLRLEMEGVLKSWAVPKGPSQIIGEKHLAVHVEDHPLAYGKFKGTIPEGNYGAGIVKIWDHGTYTALDNPKTRRENEKALLFGLNKGHIAFVAHGKKMRGAYDLVQMKNQPKNWLLIKKTDHPEATPSKPRIFSVKAKPSTTFTKLKHEKLKIKPMLATLTKQPFNREGWIFEIKWDGYRALADITKNKTTLVSRHGLSYQEIFAPIINSLQKIQQKMILDGEVVVLDENGRSDFQLLQNYRHTGEGKLIYYVFDILSYQGKSLTNKPLLERKALLQKVLPNIHNIKYSEHIITSG